MHDVGEASVCKRSTDLFIAFAEIPGVILVASLLSCLLCSLFALPSSLAAVIIECGRDTLAGVVLESSVQEASLEEPTTPSSKNLETLRCLLSLGTGGPEHASASNEGIKL